MSTMKCVLLVGEEVVPAGTEKMQLEKYGYAVRTVTTGEKAVEAVRASSDIDLILMDINLNNGIDGTQTAEIILKDYDIPVVFLLSHADPEVVEKAEKTTPYGYIVRNSSGTVLDSSIKMAFKLCDAKRQLTDELATRKKTEEALQTTEERFRAIFEKGPIGVAFHETVYDDTGRAVDYRVTDANNSYKELTGGDPRGKCVTEVFSGFEDNPLDWIGAFERAAATGEQIRFEHYLRPNNRWYECVAYQVASNHFVAAFVEITRRKQAEESLKASEKQFKQMVEEAPLGIAIVNSLTAEFYLVNRAMARITGRSIAELKSIDWVSITHPDDVQPDQEKMAEMNAGKISGFQLEKRYLHADGRYFWVNITVAPMHVIDKTKPRHLLMVEDITERKQAEENVKTQLREKDALLREVHHRIKNNIASIESLLSLQVGSTEHTEAKALLQDAVSRIQSMRVLYDKLLLSPDLHEVSIKAYVSDLVSLLVILFDSEKNITVETRIADFDIDAKTATTIGIIINELLTNVFKYAFGDRDNGTVSVSIDAEDSTVTLIIKDDGVGIDEGIMENEPPGFGLTIVKMLVEQLGGTFSIRNENGTKSVVRFEIDSSSVAAIGSE